jgi:hypothetical protein
MLEDKHPPQSGIQVGFLATIVVLVTAAIGGILGLLYLRPGEDNTLIINTILGFVTPIALGLMAKLVSEAKTAAQSSEIQAKETHDVVNSRIDEFKLQIQAIAQQEIARQLVAVREAGMQAGREEQIALSSRRIGEAAEAMEKVRIDERTAATALLTKAGEKAADILAAAKVVAEEKK